MKQELESITDGDLTALQHDLIDEGLRRGLTAMVYTHGLEVDPDVRYDVAAVAVQRLLDWLPAQVTVEEVKARLLYRATTLETRLQRGVS